MLNLKKRLEPIRLTDEQKKRIKLNAKQPKSEKARYIPVVYTAFALVAAFFVLLNLPGQDISTINDRLSAATPNLPKPDWTKSIVLHSILNSILIVASVLLLKKCLKDTLRWRDNAKVQEWNAFFSHTPRTVMLIVLTVGLLWIAVYVWPYLLMLKTILVLLLVVVFNLVVLCEIPERYESCCPHCKTTYTRKEIWRKSFNAFREKCDHCQKPIFVSEEENKRKLTIYLAPAYPILLSGPFQFPLFLVIPMLISMFISLSYFYLPYMVEFTDEDQGLKGFK